VRATKTISASVLWTALISVLIIVLYVRKDLMDLLGHPLEFPTVAVSAPVISGVLSLLLIVVGLRYFGTRSRNRPIERLKAMRRDDEEQTALTLPVRLPIHIQRRQPTRVLFLAIPIIGVVLSLLYICFSPPDAPTAPAFFWLFFMVCGIIIAVKCEPDTICDITLNGIQAPAGLLSRKRFVPWEELASCEIIHSDENRLNDYFVLWDRQGRCRLNASSWLSTVPSADRATIYQAIRSQFPGKIKGDTTRSQAIAQRYSSSQLWDEQLDG
jgi:hypothetical protein